MPHQKNPIGCENLTGLARLLRGYALAALEDVALWHERDISHSSVERVIAPDATILCDYAMARMTRIMEGLRVDPARMRANLELTGGAVFSEAVLLALVRAGLERQAAYGLVQRAALAAGQQGKSFQELLAADPEVGGRLGAEGLARCFALEPTLAKVDEIFSRVFGPGA
jgi:adenylosuccinate lyase